MNPTHPPPALLDDTPNLEEPRFLARFPDPSLASLRPPRLDTRAGVERRVGVEVEFSGLELDAAAEATVAHLDATLRRKTEYEIEVDSKSLGNLRLEVDDHRLKRLGREKLGSGELGPLDASTESFLAAFAGRLTPIELVTEPLTVDRLPALDELVRALGAAGGRGTEDGLLLAFGTHYNPEAPSFEAEDLRAHLQAFVLLFDWLTVKLDVNLTRRVTTFVDRYPESYARQLLASNGPLTLEQLIDDYLAENPTRNRALDMLPLFAHLDEERVRAVVDDGKIKARPTFHYRLTNSRVGASDWTVSRGWRYWLVVEDLAADPDRLARMTRAYLEHSENNTFQRRSTWAKRTEEVLS